jgi:integrase
MSARHWRPTCVTAARLGAAAGKCSAGVRAPHRPLTRGAITQIAARASQRCGLGTVFAHRLRHTAAAGMLRGGASLEEIGQVLRHQRALTTAIYAKVDYEALRGLAPLAGRCSVSGLHGKLEEYLAVRRAMGFKMERHEKLLAQFTGFLAGNGETGVTIENALAWATLPATAIRLDRSDYDPDAGALTVRDTKFGKSRHLPLHPTAITGLNKYLQLCGELMPVRPAPALLLTARGCRLRYERTWETFRCLTVSAGLEPRSPACRPRIHDLRHSFAVAAQVSRIASDATFPGKRDREAVGA